MNLQLFAQERTEAATPRRREDARGRGQVFKSVELTGALAFLATYLVLRWAGPFMSGRVLMYTRLLWEQGPMQDWSEGGVRILVLDLFLLSALVVTPVLAAGLVSGLLGNYMQVGFLFTFEPLVPSFERIDPISGFTRIFSRRTLVEFIKALLKMTFIGYVTYKTVADDIGSFPVLLGLDMEQTASFLIALVSRLLLWVGISFLVLAVADYVYQKWEYEESIWMTKQELKEELKQVEGNPEIRGKIKQKQRELSRQRMMQDVKKADVVVTNPTHYAVALQYRTEEMTAPRVLAKGQGLIALRIRELARENQVPIVENPPLARELHRVVEVGKEIPLDLYQAVAEVLAFVYRLKQKGY